MLNELKSNCQNCFALCCVALPYGKSSDFPLNKESGKPCQHLCSNNLCSIHDQLRNKGFRGCVSYECFGAGQHVSQYMYQGRDWREDGEHADEMFAVFPKVQQLHEMLWYLYQAKSLKETKSIHKNLQMIYDETVELTKKPPMEILEVDIIAHRSKVNVWLVETSNMYRAGIKGKSSKVRKGRDYIGANLTGVNLQGADLRGQLMIAANLANSNLRKADFIGADLRDASLIGADLRDALFLTQSQINSAKGDIHTKVPDYLERPHHWNVG